jgi:acyl-activating enzyme 14
VYLHTAPLFHIGGLSSALAMLAAGARHVFLPRFDGGALLAAIGQHRVTSFIAGVWLRWWVGWLMPTLHGRTAT